jgi:hypothetical protein
MYLTPLKAVVKGHDGRPNKLRGARSFQLGRASTPIAPHTVHTMRGPKNGTTTSSAKEETSSTAW